jgi:hypothetical protein
MRTLNDLKTIIKAEILKAFPDHFTAHLKIEVPREKGEDDKSIRWEFKRTIVTPKDIRDLFQGAIQAKKIKFDLRTVETWLEIWFLVKQRKEKNANPQKALDAKADEVIAVVNTNEQYLFSLIKNFSLECSFKRGMMFGSYGYTRRYRLTSHGRQLPFEIGLGEYRFTAIDGNSPKMVNEFGHTWNKFAFFNNGQVVAKELDQNELKAQMFLTFGI